MHSDQTARPQQKGPKSRSSCNLVRGSIFTITAGSSQCRRIRPVSLCLGTGRMLNSISRALGTLKAALAHAGQHHLHFQQLQAPSSRQHLQYLPSKSILKPVQATARLRLFHIMSSNTAFGLPLRQRQSLRGKHGGRRKGFGSKRKMVAKDCVGYAVFVQGGSAGALSTTTLPQMAQRT